MSYIRSLGNPERLYIWGTIQGRVEISNGPGELLSMPTHVFNGLLQKCDDWSLNGDDPIRFRGATLSRPEGNGEFDFWDLRYKDWTEGKFVRAWMTTWYYIAATNRPRVKKAEK